MTVRHNLQFIRWFLSPSLLSLYLIHPTHGFYGTHRKTYTTRTTSFLSALTERQMQFWEDVEEGLNDIEAFYVSSKGLHIDRVREFSRSAQGLIPPPKPSAPDHQPSEEHIEGLSAKPFWDIQPDEGDDRVFPWAAKLEANYEVILRELESKLIRDQQLFMTDSVWQNQVMGDGWSAIRLQRLGVWNPDVCQDFPETFQLLRSLSIPLAVRGVCFARQAPGTGVQPHSDGRNFILTAHLGLMIPPGCWIQVAKERRTWEVGKLTFLDTSFEHSTGNPTDSDRHVLILDFWHPDLTEAERAALEFVYDLRNKFESGKVPFRVPKAIQEGKKDGLQALWSNLMGSS